MTDSINEQLRKLKEKQAQLKARQLQLQARQNHQQRKERTHRLIQTGAVVEGTLDVEITTCEQRNALIHALTTPVEITQTTIAQYLRDALENADPEQSGEDSKTEETSL